MTIVEPVLTDDCYIGTKGSAAPVSRAMSAVKEAQRYSGVMAMCNFVSLTCFVFGSSCHLLGCALCAPVCRILELLAERLSCAFFAYE